MKLRRTAAFYASNKESRDKKKSYDTQHNKKNKNKVSSRMRARRLLQKLGKVSKGDNKDVDHANGNPLDNRLKNLRVISKTANRAKH